MVDVTDRVVWNEVNTFLDDLRNAPTQYFEANLDRLVGINEFAAAVIPDTASQKTRDLLVKHGIERIENYEKNNKAARVEAVQRAAQAVEDSGTPTMFSIADAQMQEAAQAKGPADPARFSIADGAGEDPNRALTNPYTSDDRFGFLDREMMAKTGLAGGPIKLKYGEVRGAGGYGAMHIIHRRGAQIQKLQVTSPDMTVQRYVALGLTRIDAVVKAKDGKYKIVKQGNGFWHVTIVKPMGGSFKEDRHYGINTAYLTTNDPLTNARMLWQRSEPAATGPESASPTSDLTTDKTRADARIRSGDRARERDTSIGDPGGQSNTTSGNFSLANRYSYIDIGHQNGGEMWYMGEGGALKTIDGDGTHYVEPEAIDSPIRGRIDHGKRLISLTVGLDPMAFNQRQVDRAVTSAYRQFAITHPAYRVLEFGTPETRTRCASQFGRRSAVRRW